MRGMGERMIQCSFYALSLLPPLSKAWLPSLRKLPSSLTIVSDFSSHVPTFPPSRCNQQSDHYESQQPTYA